MPNILLQTTHADASGRSIPARFSRLIELLSTLRDARGHPAFQVRARHGGARGRPDPLLSRLHETDVDQLWLLTSGRGYGLVAEDCAGISRFRRLGGNLVVAPDDMGESLSACDLGGIEAAHPSHSHDPSPGAADRGAERSGSRAGARHAHHSDTDGAFQRVRVVGSIHPVMRDRLSNTGVIQYLPSHPHEHAVIAPPGDATARVIMEGQSAASGMRFNIAVAFERSAQGGRAIAQSSCWHFADDHWNPAGRPVPSGLSDGEGMAGFAEALRSTRQYVRNLAFWLSG